MVSKINLYWSHGNKSVKYRIIDNDTRHQLMVKRLGLSAEGFKDATSDTLSRVLNENSSNEGYDLERMTVEFFGALHKVENGKFIHSTHYNAQLADDGSEIDALVSLPGSEIGKERGLLLGSCKRSAKVHIKESRSPAKVFGGFLTNLYEKRGQTRPGEIRYFSISPEFPTDQRKTLQERGFEVIDLRTMARKLGYDPGPERVT